MPVVITDFTNRTWCTEQPDDGYLHVGFVGEKGPRVEDVLDFIRLREKQFQNFLAKKGRERVSDGKRNVLRGSKNRRASSVGKVQDRDDG